MAPPEANVLDTKKKQSTASSTREQRARARRVSKGQIERKRRARINRNLNELKSFLTQDGRHVFSDNNLNASSKLDKADVLELSVKYMRSALLTMGISRKTANDEESQAKQHTFFNGFLACTMQTIAMLDSDVELQELDASTKQQVHAHLIKCLENARRTVLGEETATLPSNESKLASMISPCHSRQSSSLDGDSVLQQSPPQQKCRATEVFSPASTVHTSIAHSSSNDTVVNSPAPSYCFSSSSVDCTPSNVQMSSLPMTGFVESEPLKSQAQQLTVQNSQPPSVFVDLNQLLLLQQLQAIATSTGQQIIWPTPASTSQQPQLVYSSAPQAFSCPNDLQALLLSAQASGRLPPFGMDTGNSDEPWRPW